MFHEPPTFFLHAPLSRVQNHQLAALLQFGVAQDEVLTSVVVGDEFGGGFGGVHPFGG